MCHHVLVARVLTVIHTLVGQPRALQTTYMLIGRLSQVTCFTYQLSIVGHFESARV